MSRPLPVVSGRQVCAALGGGRVRTGEHPGQPRQTAPRRRANGDRPPPRHAGPGHLGVGPAPGEPEPRGPGRPASLSSSSRSHPRWQGERWFPPSVDGPRRGGGGPVESVRGWASLTQGWSRARSRESRDGLEGWSTRHGSPQGRVHRSGSVTVASSSCIPVSRVPDGQSRAHPACPQTSAECHLKRTAQRPRE